MNIYLASSWKNGQVITNLAKLLRAQGFQVDAFTDGSTGRHVFHYKDLADAEQLNAMTALENEQVQKAFEEDRKWLDGSDVVVLALPSGKSAHLEAGYAVGKGKKLIILQLDYFPEGEFDVMYGFADLVTEFYDEVVDRLRLIRQEMP